jgi:hypothetical protein
MDFTDPDHWIILYYSDVQVQTFNTSLPHAFVGLDQATTVVNHRVEITDKLDIKVVPVHVTS